MPEHKLSYGKEIITKLIKLGQILGYHTQREHPVDRIHDSAVDVAWLYELGQQYPLFIFEIESKTTNSIPANPLKIFGESNQKFEKPLFLFHLLLSGGQDSAKVRQLERTYGTYNYRIYRFSLDEDLKLLKDILSQHRRLTNSLKIVPFFQEILASWKHINVSTIAIHLENLEFENKTGNILPAYADLYKTYPEFKEQFIRRLKAEATSLNNITKDQAYESYLGQAWSTPVHLGIMSLYADSRTEYKYYEDFKLWLEKSSNMKLIGPFFGLSRDYDLFILGMSGAVFGLVAALFYKIKEAKYYIANELYEIILEAEKGFPAEFSLVNALWLLHISPNSPEGQHYFSYARNLINMNGGIPKSIFDKPLVEYYGFIEDDESLEDYGIVIQIPEWDDFQKLKENVKPDNDVLFNLAVSYLTDPSSNWNPISTNQL